MHPCTFLLLSSDLPLRNVDKPCTCLLQVHNESGSKRVIVTKELPGDRWLDILKAADIRVEVSKHPDTILDNATIKKLMGDKCDGVIGQLTEASRAGNGCGSWLVIDFVLGWWHVTLAPAQRGTMHVTYGIVHT